MKKAAHCSHKMATNRQARNWCFTINGYDNDTLERLKVPNDAVLYLVAGLEVAPTTGTKHIQGFVSLKKKLRMNQVKKIIGASHLTVANGSPEQNRTYCTKEGDFFEYGQIPAGQGKRNELEAFKEAVKAGLTDMKEVREKFSSVYAKHRQFCVEYIQDYVGEKHEVDGELREWQQLLYERLLKEPDDRTVIFVVDFLGNRGKTWFTKWCRKHLKKRFQCLVPSGTKDMAYALDETSEVVFMDCPRSKQGVFIQYDFLEHIKNGRVFSSKYESRVKFMPKCHVVVFMNEEPDMEKLSADRYDVIYID